MMAKVVSEPISVEVKRIGKAPPVQELEQPLELYSGSELARRQEQPIKPLKVEFWREQGSMEPSSQHWREGNQKKMLSFVKDLARENGLNGGQAGYLAVTLFAFASAHRELGGSLSTMEFNPEKNNMFTFEAIDLFGYEFDPAKYPQAYERVTRRGRITLGQLEHDFGFQDLALKDMREMPQSELKPNPQDETSAVKFRLLELANRTHPERVRMHSAEWGSLNTVKVFYQDVSKEPSLARLRFLTELKLGDFQLNRGETAMLNASNDMLELRETLAHISHGENGIYTQTSDRDKKTAAPTDVAGPGKETLDKISPAVESMLEFPFDLERGILSARAKLEYLGRESTEKLTRSFDDILKQSQTAISAVDDFYSLRPDLAQAAQNDGTVGDRIAQAKERYQRLLETRRTLGEERLLNPPEAEK
jgi:hypothetical protein